MQKISLSIDLVNSVLNYLGSRPFFEVANLINGIQSEAKSQVEEAPKEEPVENSPAE